MELIKTIDKNLASKKFIINSIDINRNKKYLTIKRLIDIICALIGLIILFPFFLLVAIAIKIEEPRGTIFFKQARIGRNGKEFEMYKFRSMIENAEEQLNKLKKFNDISGAMFKMKNDPRITKIGIFIRRTSIDELPQLWNVIVGDMSLVGPRPPLPREVEKYTNYDKQRLFVTPGCTGLWQVNGRNSVGFNEMVQIDIDYIQKRTIWLDLSIIFKTIIVMIKQNDAY